jgi:phosphoserine phosphatase RsbU/P
VRVLTDGGIVLGIFPDAKYLDGAMHLEPGNKLLLFTDGIMEATNTRGQEYGEDDCDGNLMTIQAERLRRCITN